MFLPNLIPCQYGIDIFLSNTLEERNVDGFDTELYCLLTICFKYEWHYIAKRPMQHFSCILYPTIQSSLLISCLLLLMLRKGGVSMLYQPRHPKMACACAVIKTTSSSITVQPLWLLPSRRCKGIFLPGNCGGWLQLVPGAKRGWGVAQGRLIESFVG